MGKLSTRWVAWIAASLLAVPLTAAQADAPPKGMVKIPGGTSVMGINTENGDNPSREVTIASFLLDTHEVTGAEYAAFCEATDRDLPYFWGQEEFRSGPEYGNHPMVGVSWSDARAYARWAGKRLPTEAEWEYAARGGDPEIKYPFGPEITSENASYAGSKPKGLRPVGSFKPNAYGLYDMAGNVVEWVSDWYDEDAYRTGPAKNPQGPARGKFKVIRGGGWFSGPGCCTVSFRNALRHNWGDFNVGFRCAKDLPGPREVEFFAEGDVTVTADLHLVEAGRSAPLVILFHQARSNARGEYSGIVPRLLAAGLNVLAVDQRSGGSHFGSSNRTVAGVGVANLSYCDAYPDLVAALDYADLAGLNGKRLVWGSSYSAGLVINLAADNSDRLDGVLAFSPAAGPPMAQCDPTEAIAKLDTPTLALRPASEMKHPSVQTQWKAFESGGHRTFVAEHGVHGSSMLDPARASGEVESTWKAVLEFITEVVEGS